MKIGTKSVLFGAHCFFIHPWFLAVAWYRLYGFEEVEDPYVGKVSLKSPLLWLSFFIHDLGYWGKPNMDGDEGEDHPWWAASVMWYLFDTTSPVVGFKREQKGYYQWVGPWGRFCLFHSRFLAKKYNQSYSLLCVSDKLAVSLEPWWLYLPRVILTGEIKEYMGLARDRNSKFGRERRRRHDFKTRREWQARMASYCRNWAAEHKDGKQDKWTPDHRQAKDELGVWQ